MSGKSMARKKGKMKRARRKQGISILGVAETVALSNVATQTLFNVNAYDFILGGSNFQGGNQITLRELFNPMQTVTATRPQAGSLNPRSYTAQAGQTTDLIAQNLKANWLQGTIGMVTVPLMFRVGKQLARPAISRVNSLLRKAGVASTIKV